VAQATLDTKHSTKTNKNKQTHDTDNSKDNFNIIHFANGGHKRKKMSI
jgi:hypothetical protein